MSQGEPAHKIPRAVLRIAAAKHLGIPEASYLPRNMALLFLLAGSLLIAVGAVIILSFSYLFDNVFSWWPRWQALSIPFLGVGWIGVGLWITLSPLLSAPPQVFVFSNGFVRFSRIKRRVEAVRWEEIEKLWRQLNSSKKGRVTRSYRVRTKDNDIYIFNEYLVNNEQLGSRLEEEIERQQLPSMISLYDTGVPLIFGDIIISVQGIGVKRGRKILPWKEIEKIVIDDALVSVCAYGDARGPRKQPIANIADVPNVIVLSGLVAYVMNGWRPTQLPQLIAYNAGERVFFGALNMSKRGVEIPAQKKLLPWNEIASMSVGERDVLIRRHSEDWEWYTIPNWSIADIAAFKELLEQILRTN